MTITPPDMTAITVEAVTADPEHEVRITVERGNGASIQDMVLTTQEWRSLQFLLETFGENWSPSVHVSFKAIPCKRGSL